MATGKISTVAGTGQRGLDKEHDAVKARLNAPGGLAVDAAGTLYIADTQNHQVRKVVGGAISTVAEGFSFPTGLAIDSLGNLYVADAGHNQIRKISPAGVVTTIAGNGKEGNSGDGQSAVEAELNQPEGVAVDKAGNVYLTDTGNDQVRKASNGVIAFVTDKNVGGEGCLSVPTGIAVDSMGNIYFSSTNTSQVLKFSTTGETTEVTRHIAWPKGLTLVKDGDEYVAGWGEERVCEISGGQVTPVAGTGKSGYDGDDKDALTAKLSEPEAVAVDAAGNFYIAESMNHRVRKVTVAAHGPQTGV